MNKLLSKIKDFPQDFVFSDYDWQCRQLIGEGAFGKIFKVKNNKENIYDAIKRLDMSFFDQEFKLQALKTEIKIMSKLQSQNIVQIKDSFIGKRYSYIILELCDSDLRKELMQNNGKLMESQCCEIFHQIAKGLYKMHKHEYIHRDIKPDNVLVKGGVYKIADFGFGVRLRDKEEMQEACGTPLYMAPQLVFKEKYTDKCDIWSLGLMLYEMVFGFNPWPTKHPQIYKNSIKSKPVAFPYDCKIGKYTYDFLKRCLQVQEKKRMSWQQFFSHPFIKQKNTGQPVTLPTVSQKNQRVLKSVQQSILRRNINLLQCFQKYSNKFYGSSLQKPQFFKFLKQMDPTITTYESQELFMITDKDNNAKVSMQEFYQMFCEIDYRPCEDIVSRRIQEVIVIAQVKGVSMKELWRVFDKDGSGAIDRQEFNEIMWKIEPNMPEGDVGMVWERFDANRSGHIQRDEFIAEMTRNSSIQMKQSISRAKRNISCLQQYLKTRKTSLKQFFTRTDTNKDNNLSLTQFGLMTQSINYQITKEEIVEMFQMFDVNKNGRLEIGELEERVRDCRLG